jgi:hypothetical protein
MPSYQEILSQAIRVLMKSGKNIQELGPHFAEKSTDDHVHLVQHGHFFTYVQQLIQDQRHEQDLDGDEGNILEQIENSISLIVKNNYLDDIEKC